LVAFADRSIEMRLTPELLTPIPSHVFVLAGINDINRRSGGVAEYLDAYRRILGTLRQHYPNVELVCQSVLPTRGVHAHLNPSIRDFNQGLRALAAELGAGFLDLHPLYADARGELRRLVSRDGLHPRRFSQSRWRRALEAHLHWPSRRRLPALLRL
jgi:lysophospholipase L1-like esterase